jgi:hypothetical protein
MLVRARAKDAVRVSADIDELKELGEELDGAVEEFDVRTLPPESISSYPHYSPGCFLHPC